MQHREGMKGFFRGNLANCVKIGPFSAVEFQSYSFFKSKILSSKNDKAGMLVCGGLSGASALFLTYPLDLAKTLLSVQVPTHSLTVSPSGTVATLPPRYTGIWDCMAVVFRREGIRGLQKGASLGLAGWAPFVAIKMSAFDILQMNLNLVSNRATMNFLNGALAGTTATLVLYPMDLLRRRAQVFYGTNKQSQTAYKNSVHMVREIFYREGLSGFQKGLGPCILKVAPTFAITFALNEKLKLIFSVKW